MKKNFIPQSNETEKMQILRMNATPKLLARNLAEKLIGNEQRCSFVFCTGRLPPCVIKDYVQVANLSAGLRPQYDGL